MKKLLSLLLCLLFLLTGCDSEDSLPISGEILDYDNTQKVFLLDANTGGDFACFVSEDTQFIVETDGVEETYTGKNVDLCEVLRYYYPVRVTLGESFEPEENPFSDISDASYWANTVWVSYDSSMNATDAKPVIYLYPETETEVSVKLNYDGKLTCTYPKYEDGWTITAAPDGTLTDEAGKEYNYLYWEGETDAEYDFSKGFCVPGQDSALFLEDALEKLGLSRREANEFIVYWLPILEANPYNLIAFQTDAYTSHARLSISPAPDTLIRVFMAFQPLEAPVEIESQILTAPKREGFTVIEWGGAQIP